MYLNVRSEVLRVRSEVIVKKNQGGPFKRYKAEQLKEEEEEEQQ